jgi:ABC-type multidrug transport system ATPase subunit
VGLVLNLFSHILILLIPIALFSSSGISRFPAKSYSTVKLAIPPRFVAEPQMSRMEKFSELRDLLSGPIPLLNLEQYLQSCEFLRGTFGSEIRLLTKTPFRNSARTILDPGPLYFVPDSEEVRSLINFMNVTYPSFSSLEVIVGSSVNIIAEHSKHLSPAPLPFALIQFHYQENGSYSVDIRQAHDPYFSTNQFVSDIFIGFDLSFINYWIGGFFSLQRGIESWLCEKSEECDPNAFAPSAIIPFPTPSYSVFEFFSSIGSLLGMMLCLASVFPLARQAKYLVDDKESGVRQLLFSMGLLPCGYYLGTSMFYFLLYCWISFSFSLCLWLSLFQHTKFSYIFAMVFLFHASLQQVMNFVASCFHRGKFAAAAAAITIFVFSLPRYFLISSSNTQFVVLKYLLAIAFPSSAFVFALDFISKAEYVGTNIDFVPWKSNQFDFASTLFCMGMSAIFYGVLSQWATIYMWVSSVNMGSVFLDKKSLDREICQPTPTEAKIVEICNLTKIYSHGRHVALDNISIAFFENQVTCVVGQNGAGKSSLVSILSGIRHCTSGSIWFDGVDVSHLSQAQRRNIGICSQNDILVPTLTVEEHLRFVIEMKGLHYQDRETHANVRALIDCLELTEKKSVQSRFLSGGMQRKLCLAMALVANPKFVILDEPTSGVDVISQRKIWEVLLAQKHGKAILLTTHFMEEAEFLSDKIVMLSQGQVVCQGNVCDVKASSGQNGFLLRLFKSPLSNNSDVGPQVHNELESITKCSIYQYPTPNSYELAFLIPQSCRTLISAVFKKLQSHWTSFDAMRLQGVTLEHAFLSLVSSTNTRDTWTSPLHSQYPRNSVNQSNPTSSGANATHYSPIQTVIGVIFWRKYLQYRRNLCGPCLQLLSAALAMILSITVLFINLSPSYVPLPLAKESFYTNVQFFPKLFTSSSFPSDLSIGNVTILPTEFRTSSEMSSFIATQKFSPKDGTGALIFQDIIPVEASINVNWFLQNPELSIKLITFLNSMGMDLPFYPSVNLNFDKIKEAGLKILNTDMDAQIETRLFYWNSFLSVMHRSPYIHSAAIFMTEVVKQSLKFHHSPLSVNFTNFPLPASDSILSFSQIQLSVVMVVLLLIPACCIPVIIVSSIVSDRNKRCKLLHHLSGVTGLQYWLIHWLFDFIILLIPIVIFLIGLLSLKSISETVFAQSWQAFNALVISLVCFCFGTIPFSYFLTFFCNSDGSSSAVAFVLFVNIITGFGLTVAYFLLLSQQQSDSDPLTVAIQYLFGVFPAFNLGIAMVRICLNFYQNSFAGENYSFLAWNVTLTPIVLMISEGCIYFWLVLYLDDFQSIRDILQCTSRKNDKFQRESYNVDDDILREELNVMQVIRDIAPETKEVSSDSCEDGIELGHSQISCQNSIFQAGENFPLVMDQLWKVYRSKSCLSTSAKDLVALRGISLVCNCGERLGLLGINGAGKSTTMRILTRETVASSGQVYVGGVPLSDPKAMAMIGYCPQTNPIFDDLDAYETLWYYGRIRGIDKDILSQRIEYLITQTGLSAHAHRPSGTYSGGNKRKLSLAIALIGDPKVLLLDEPSTGMDPFARRLMWRVIQQVSDNRTVILVSHSMEEIEALCTRIAVLAGGKLRCLGSIPHLAAKQNTGYVVSFRCNPQLVNQCVAECSRFLISDTSCQSTAEQMEETKTEDRFVIVEDVQPIGMARLRVGRSLDLASAFSGFEEITNTYDIQDLSITLGSLDTIFNQSAKENNIDGI